MAPDRRSRSARAYWRLAMACRASWERSSDARCSASRSAAVRSASSSTASVAYCASVAARRSRNAWRRPSMSRRIRVRHRLPFFESLAGGQFEQLVARLDHISGLDKALSHHRRMADADAGPATDRRQVSVRLLHAGELKGECEQDHADDGQCRERGQQQPGDRLRQQRRLERRPSEAPQRLFPEQRCGQTSSAGTKYMRNGSSSQPKASNLRSVSMPMATGGQCGSGKIG